MKTLRLGITIAATASLTHAQSFIALLDATQDGGGTRSGSGVFSLTMSETVMTISGDFDGLSGTAVNAHIHGPAPTGQNAGVLYGLFNFITFAPGNNSGSINAPVSLVDNPNGTIFDIPAQLDQLNSGQWYFNIHSSAFGGGEIRGQILSVPEPSTIAMSDLGIVSFVIWQIRRHLT